MATCDLRRERPAVGSLKTALVGREPELGRLREAFEQATREAHAAPVHDPRRRRGSGSRGSPRSSPRKPPSRRSFSSAAACRTARASRSGRCARSSASSRRRPELASPKDDEARPLAEGLQEAIGGAADARARGDLLGDAQPLRGARPRAAARRLLRGRPLGRAHLPRPGRVPGREDTGCCRSSWSASPAPSSWSSEPTGAANGRTRGPCCSSAFRIADCEALIGNLARRSRAGDRGPRARNRRGKPPLHRAARRHARRRTRLRGRALDPADDRRAALGPPGPARAGRAGRDLPRRGRRQGVLRRGHASICCPRTPARSARATSRPWRARSSSVAAPAPGTGESFRFRHILIQQAAYRATPKTAAGGASRALRRLDRGPGSDAESPSTPRSSATTSSRRFDTGPSSGPSASRSWSSRIGPATISPPRVERAFQRGDMPATVNLLGRAAALPDTQGRRRPRGAPGARLRAVRDRRGGRGERRARRRPRAGAGGRRSPRGVAGDRSPVRASRCTGTPEGIDLDALTAETETAIEVLGELGDEAGLARAYMVLSDLHLEPGQAQRDERCGDPGGRACPPGRQSPRGRLGARPERPLRDPRPDAGRRGPELARAVASKRSRRTAPWTRTCPGSSRCWRR